MLQQVFLYVNRVNVFLLLMAFAVGIAVVFKDIADFKTEQLCFHAEAFRFSSLLKTA